jgi:hypothetical protein
VWYSKDEDYSIHTSKEWGCRKDEKDVDGKTRSMLSGVVLGREF